MSWSASQERQPSATSSILSRTWSAGHGSSERSSGGAQRSENPTVSPCAHREGRAHGRVLDLHGHPRLHRDAPDAAKGPAAALLFPEERLDEPVLGPRRELELELYAAAHALHGAQQLVRRVEAEVVAALAVGERERVEQSHGARVRREGGLHDERAGQIAPLGARSRLPAGSTSDRRRDRAGARRPRRCRSGAGRASRSSPPRSTSAAVLQSASRP